MNHGNMREICRMRRAENDESEVHNFRYLALFLNKMDIWFQKVVTNNFSYC